MNRDVYSKNISEEIEIIYGCVKSIGKNYLELKRASNSRNVGTKTKNTLVNIVTQLKKLLGTVTTEELCKEFEGFINIPVKKSEVFQDNVTSLAESAQSKEALKHVESLIEINFKELQNRDAILDANITLLTIFVTFLLVGSNILNPATAATVAALFIAVFKIVFEIKKQSMRSIFNYVLITLKRAQEEK